MFGKQLKGLNIWVRGGMRHDDSVTANFPVRQPDMDSTDSSLAFSGSLKTAPADARRSTLFPHAT